MYLIHHNNFATAIHELTSINPGTMAYTPLTKREREIMAHLSKGYTRMEVAEKLYISSATVKKHLQNIFRKLKVNNLIQALNRSGITMTKNF